MRDYLPPYKCMYTECIYKIYQKKGDSAVYIVRETCIECNPDSIRVFWFKYARILVDESPNSVEIPQIYIYPWMDKARLLLGRKRHELYCNVTRYAKDNYAYFYALKDSNSWFAFRIK